MMISADDIVTPSKERVIYGLSTVLVKRSLRALSVHSQQCFWKPYLPSLGLLLTLCILMDSSYWFDTINLGWSIVYV